MAPSLMVELDTMKTKLDADYERYKQSQRSQLEIQAKLDTELRAKRQRSEVESVQRAKAQESASAQKASRISPQDIQKRLQALHINSNTSTAAQELAFTKTSRPSLPNSPISFSLPRRLTETPPSVVDRPGSTAPASEHYFTSSASLENDYPLKTIFLPSSLQSTFLSLASSNTARNLETCGILSGTLRNNAYFVTTLIVPAQESTSDTCHTTDEEGLFNYQDANDLFTLGWIHTHPTQTCFLSSVDLHTQCGYQLMLPESIAIVLAPSKTPSAGTFRLTDPPGLHTIKTCTRGGLFHPHDEGGGTMYVGADRASAGHVKEVEGMTFTVEDQRL
ncbi:AMSH-like protease [Taphrina deformans PYCC 5710]|uniref:AMSH-like protease n=1 Tax=Taphrina deformans (strain PYCC 5710 / ATCC 11124 / CBS 356.35 / IMI 108563 / JCM 9778 / NBRC 8474) TaxID=1097556 RepID=R4XGQ4_TAPDE|nr:AMSH-like protease [Taphrina deformans PYCC 5710]|eukprot:CCG82566.1 AMSH-like protease [Taphrina deformans PYCC 5710]